jgi:hypothetical protein
MEFFMKSSVFKQSAIVVALAASGLAHADANPFGFYALLDGGISTTKITGGGTATTGTTTEFNTGNLAPNFIGITGSKTVGEITAGYKLEEGFLLSNANSTNTSAFGPTGPSNNLFNRQANLFVSGDFGKFSLGTVTDSVFEGLLATDPLATSYGSAVQGILGTGGGSIVSGAVRFDTAKVNGFSASITYKTATSGGSAGSNSGNLGTGTRISGIYSNNGLTATAGHWIDNASGAAFSSTNTYNLTTGAATSVTPTTITSGQLDSGTYGGLAYNTGKLTLNGNYMRVTQNETYQESTGSLNVTGLGGSYAIDAKNNIGLAFHTYKDGGTLNGTNVSAIAALYTYEFIPGMKVYGLYSSIKDSSTGTSAFGYYTGGNTVAGSLLANQTAQIISAGLQYGFF